MAKRTESKKVIVQKYGGACLETSEKIRLIARDLAEMQRQGHKVVVIVSAMGKTTDELIKRAYDVSPSPNRRELDMLLSTGERVSMSLMSMALVDLGASAISFTGSQAGVITDNAHSQARILNVTPIRVEQALNNGQIVVLAGFQGVSHQEKEITTLGRGGSDTTAVAMAAALKADLCEIIKEVDGVCTADPRVVTHARGLSELNHSSLTEMCFWGAKVLHYRSVELAQRKQVPLVIRKWGQSMNQTKVVEDMVGFESGTVLAVNSWPRIEHIEADGSSLNACFDRLNQHLQATGLAVPQILASAFNSGKCRWMLTGDNESLDALLSSLKSTKDLRVHRATLSSVTLTCYGAVGSSLPFDVLAKLSAAKIVVDKYILSAQSLTLVVQPEDREKAIRVLHEYVG